MAWDLTNPEGMVREFNDAFEDKNREIRRLVMLLADADQLAWDGFMEATMNAMLTDPNGKLLKTAASENMTVVDSITLLSRGFADAAMVVRADAMKARAER